MTKNNKCCHKWYFITVQNTAAKGGWGFLELILSQFSDNHFGVVPLSERAQG